MRDKSHGLSLSWISVFWHQLGTKPGGEIFQQRLLRRGIPLMRYQVPDSKRLFLGLFLPMVPSRCQR